MFTKFASLWRHQLNNVSHLFILVQSFPYADFWMCKNHKVVTKFCNFAVIESNQMLLGVYVYYKQVINVKFNVKIPSGCLENGK